MSYPFDVHPLAEDELFAEIDYLERKREGYGALLADVAAQTLDSITETPERFPLVFPDSGRRRALLGKPFQKTYSIYFDFDQERVLIVSFFNNRRDPNTWQSRR